jgi:aminopeptidase-like protein
MKDYHALIEKLAEMDRCHCGPEMEEAYKVLQKYYSGSRLIQYNTGEKIHHWELPPYWVCNKANLYGPSGDLLVSRDDSKLNVFSYSPGFEGVIELEELQKHLFSNPAKPDTVPFHFRNQYRFRNAEWGFCLSHKLRESLLPGKYRVEIDTELKEGKLFSQVDYHKAGATPKEVLLMGHFDHPSQVNDGLAGTIVAFEVLKRLQERPTKYSYRAFASVEIVGSAAYLHHERNIQENLIGGIFLATAGIDSPLKYQTSFYDNSLIDRAIKNVIDPKNEREVIFDHRELIGNDENVFDSIGYEIPMGTFLRWPFENYHTNFDNFKNYKPAKAEEMVEKTLKVIDILELDAKVQGNFKGIPSLSNPEINLYLSPSNISQLKDFSAKENYSSIISDETLAYIEREPDLLYHFMRITLRMANGGNTILDICERTKIPFDFGYKYIKKLEEKGIVSLEPVD